MSNNIDNGKPIQSELLQSCVTVAAIDNVARKLMQGGKPRSRGILLRVWLLHCGAGGRGSRRRDSRCPEKPRRGMAWKNLGGVISTSVSAFFLFLIAVMNVVILRGVWCEFGKVRRGEPYNNEDLDLVLAPSLHALRQEDDRLAAGRCRRRRA